MSCIFRLSKHTSKGSLSWKCFQSPAIYTQTQPFSARPHSALRKAGQPAKRRKRSAVPYASIVNEELCDNALKLLAPSLEKHRGCNLVDIFPGTGLWSRKIHEFLQPRRHLVVEEDEGSLSEHLHPLRDEHPSRFRFLPLKNQYEAVFEWFDDAAAQLDQRERTGSNVDEPNNDTLVLATLTKLQRRHAPGNSAKMKAMVEGITLDLSPSESFLYLYIKTLLDRIGLNSSGPVRILVWVYDRDKFHYIPRGVHGRNRAAHRIEEVFSAREILGSSAPPPWAKRPASLELQSAQSAAERMQESGITLPSKRQSAALRSIVENPRFTVPGIGGGDDFTGDINAAIAELQRLEVLYRLGQFKRTVRGVGSRASGAISDFTNEYNRLYYLKDQLNNSLGAEYAASSKTATELVDSLVACYKLLNSFESSGFAFDDPMNRDELQSLVQKGIDNGTERSRILARRMFDDVSSFYRDSPLLLWDRRPFEPLLCFPEDFYLNTPLALLDLEPHQSSPRQTVTDTHFIRMLRQVMGRSLPEALDQVAHGAAEGLIPMCPSITDGHRGGLSDLRELRIRCLTQEMLKELLQAWNRWPFKTSDEQLYLDQGSNSKRIFNDVEWI